MVDICCIVIIKGFIMQISSSMGAAAAQYTEINSTSSVKSTFTEKLTDEETQQLRAQIVESSSMFMFESASVQTNILSTEDKFTQDYSDFQSFLSEVGYTGKPISELSQDEAAELVSEDGLFGIEQTSQRIADFVIEGAGGDEDKLRAGREGMLKGFQMAEDMWGGELPEISQTTMAKATEMVDMAMNSLGFSILNEEA